MFSLKKDDAPFFFFSSGHVRMWELDCEESWAPKNWCFWTVVLLEKTLESPLNCKEIQPVHSKGDQSWVFFGRTDAKAETPILWPPHAKSWPIGKDSDDGRDWGQEEKGTTEDEMARWHHRLNWREFEWTPGVGDGQGGLACCDSWGRKESDTAERLNWRGNSSYLTSWGGILVFYGLWTSVEAFYSSSNLLAFKLKLTPLAHKTPRPSDFDWSYTSSLLGFQFANCRSLDFSASIITWGNCL